MQEITTILDRAWAKKPAHLHRLELWSTAQGAYYRIDLDCNWEEDITLEQRLAVFKGDREMTERYLREKGLQSASLSTVVAKRLWTETKHLYLDSSADPADVTRRVKRAVELLPDMARWQPNAAHHEAIDINAFGDIHVSQLSSAKWESLYLLPADYHSKPKDRVLRASLPRVA